MLDVASAVGREGHNGCDDRTMAVAHARKGIECRTCRGGCALLGFVSLFGRVMHAVEGAGAVVRHRLEWVERGMDLVWSIPT